MPAVCFVSPAFRALALRRREALAIEAPMIWTVHPMMTLTQAEVEALADRVLPDVIQALTVAAQSA